MKIFTEITITSLVFLVSGHDETFSLNCMLQKLRINGCFYLSITKEVHLVN
jgi:hypothetical protein